MSPVAHPLQCVPLVVVGNPKCGMHFPHAHLLFFTSIIPDCRQSPQWLGFSPSWAKVTLFCWHTIHLDIVGTIQSSLHDRQCVEFLSVGPEYAAFFVLHPRHMRNL